MIVRSAYLEALSRVQHGFLTREGGVSKGPYASLNCGSANGDDSDCVTENRQRAVLAVDDDASSLCTARQVHGTDAIIVETAWAADQSPQADALITNRPGIALGVTSADCAPVLIADSGAGIIAAVHAGWRGALAGVVDSTVAAMVKLGGNPDRMVAAVGPCIAQQSYEVGAEFPAPFLEQNATNQRFFVPADTETRFRFDLSGYVCSRISKIGVLSIDPLGLDTCADEARFFSYRRARQQSETVFGLGISIISLQ